MNLLTPFLGFPNPFTSSLLLRFTTSLLELPRSIYFLFTSYYFCEPANHYSCYFGLLGLLYYFLFSLSSYYWVSSAIEHFVKKWASTKVFFFFLIFINYVFGYCVSISHHKVLSLPFIALVKFWFELILSFFFFFFFCGNRNLSFYQNTVYMAMNLNMPTNCLKFWIINNYKAYLLYLWFYFNFS